MTEEFYVNIENPAEFRRKLLETSKEVVIALQKFERLKASRIKRLENYDQLRMNIREINELVAKLKKELPAIRIPKRAEPKTVKAPKAKKTIAPKPAPIRASAADKLEKELSEIESKLKALQ